MKKGLAVLAVLLVAGGIVIWRGASSRAVPEPREAPHATVAQPGHEPPLLPPPEAVETVVPLHDEAVPARVEIEPTEVDAAPPTEDELPLASIHGRFLLEDGSPAVGVRAGVNGWAGNQERRLKYGVPDQWEEPSGTTDANGELLLRFDPPRAFQFALDATLAGYPAASWRWREIAPGERVELGEVVLQRGGAIEGRLVDARGEPILGEEWVVYADARLPASSGRDRDETRGIARLDPATGRFRFDDMPPGEASLRAHSDMANWIDGPVVVVVAGEVTEADIRYEGPDNATRITVTTFTRPFHPFSHPEQASIRLEGSDGVTRTAEKIEGSSQSYSFDDVAPGVYSVLFEHPLYRPWRKDGVSPGQEVNANIQGNSALSFDVSDEATGAAIERYSVRVRFRNVNFRPDEFEVHDGTTPLENGLFEGMFAGDSTVRVAAEGYGPTEVDVDGLQPNETRRVELALAPPRVVHGHVTSSDETAVAGLGVRLFRETAVVDDEEGGFLVRDVVIDDGTRFSEVDADTTDRLGAFRFEIVSAARHLVSCELSPGVGAVSAPFTVAPGEERSIDLTLPATASLDGRVTGISERELVGMRLMVVPLSALRADLFAPTFAEVTLDETGAFTFQDVAPGGLELELFLGESEWMGFDEVGRPSGRRIAELQLAPGEHRTLDIDASGSEPARIEVRVVRNGEPGIGLDVQSMPDIGPWESAATDARGVAVLRVFPGSYRIAVGAEGWSHTHPTPVVVAAGERAVTDIVVENTKGQVTLVDAEGRNLSPCIVQIGTSPESSEFPFDMVMSDEGGRLELVLSPGEYFLQAVELAADGTQTSYSGSLQWTREGPPAETVTLTRTEGD